MRITKKWLKERKLRLLEHVKGLTKLSHKQLRQAVKSILPYAVIHESGCSNCGQDLCQCSLAEKAAAAADWNEMMCLRTLLNYHIEEQLPSNLVD